MSSATKTTRKVPRALLASMLAISLIPAAPSIANAKEGVGQNAEAESTSQNLEIKNATNQNTKAADTEGAFAQNTEGTEAFQPTSWEAYGTCEWKVDDTGCLIVRPANEAESGTLTEWEDIYIYYSVPPWYQLRDSITSARFEGKVFAPVDASCMFRGCSNLESVDLSGLDTSNTEDMSYMFYDCAKLTSLDLSNFDTSNVKTMSCMFPRCSSLETLDLSSFDTANVEDTSDMFAGCRKLELLNLSGFDTSKVENMSEMFLWCSSLTSLDLSSFDTSKVKNMSSIFCDCSSLTSIDLSGFDTSRVKYMSCMVSGCSSLGSLDVTNLDTSNATDMSYMFSGCAELKTINPSGLNTANVTNISGMFSKCTKLTSIDLSSFSTSKVTNMSNMFSGCSSLISLDLSSLSTANVRTTENMFAGCPAVRSVKIGEQYEGPLPVPEDSEVTGLWLDAATNKAYTATEAPRGKVATYIAQFKPAVRLGGETRIDTMALITQTGFPKDHGCNAILLTTAYNYADALSASALAGALGAPLITTSGTSLDAAARAEIERLANGATKVYVLGGEAALSANVEREAAGVPGVTSVERLYGESRVETGLEICRAGAGLWSRTCVIANAFNYADALGAGTFCAANRAPLFGTSGGILSDEQVNLIKSGGFERAVVLGGPAAVDANAVRTQLGGGIEVLALAGETRIETSRLLAEWACGLTPQAVFQPDEPLALDRLSVVNAWNYADALAAVNLSERFGAPVLLVDGTDAARASVSAVVGAHRFEMRSTWVLGGTSAVPAEVEEWLAQDLSLEPRQAV